MVVEAVVVVVFIILQLNNISSTTNIKLLINAIGFGGGRGGGRYLNILII